MPWTHIGKCGTADPARSNEWMVNELRLGVVYVRHACGPRPLGCEVGVMWHDGETGRYATVGVEWDDSIVQGVPHDYIARAARALNRFHNAVAWEELGPETGTHSLNPEEELAAILLEIPAKRLADQLTAIFFQVHETDGQWLAGETCVYQIYGESEILDFGARLDRFDPMKLVTRFHQVCNIDLRNLEDTDPRAVAAAVLAAACGDPADWT